MPHDYHLKNDVPSFPIEREKFILHPDIALLIFKKKTLKIPGM